MQGASVLHGIAEVRAMIVYDQAPGIQRVAGASVCLLFGGIPAALPPKAGLGRVYLGELTLATS